MDTDDHRLLTIGHIQFIYVPAFEHLFTGHLEFTFDTDFLPVIDLANVQCLEMFSEIFIAHPKGAIISKLGLELTDDIRFPVFLVGIAPITLPFESAPGVPDVE